jgi:hypothetical protein
MRDAAGATLRRGAGIMMAVGAGALVLATLASAATNLISSGTFEGSG